MTERCTGNWDQSIKGDMGKPQMGFLLEFPHAVEALVRISEMGARKYGKGSWPRVEKERYLHAFMRHVLAIGVDGRKIDPESQMQHKWHALWNLAALIEIEAREKEDKAKQ